MHLIEQAPCPRRKSYPELTEAATKRFWAKVDKTPGHGPWGDCWLWTGAKHQHGYGRHRFKIESYFAHITSYRMVYGEVPLELELDHVCRIKACVNPDHLEPVPHRENLMRGECPTAKFALQTHCLRGHEFTDENTYRWRNVGRLCRACRALHNKYRKKKAVA